MDSHCIILIYAEAPARRVAAEGYELRSILRYITGEISPRYIKDFRASLMMDVSYLTEKRSFEWNNSIVEAAKFKIAWF